MLIKIISLWLIYHLAYKYHFQMMILLVKFHLVQQKTKTLKSFTKLDHLQLMTKVQLPNYRSIKQHRHIM